MKSWRERLWDAIELLRYEDRRTDSSLAERVARRKDINTILDTLALVWRKEPPDEEGLWHREGFTDSSPAFSNKVVVVFRHDCRLFWLDGLRAELIENWGDVRCAGPIPTPKDP